tara:strand:+ start:442 stop:918 length:477 start_codon:yes stop_codon:yes gene_type:complete
MLRLAKDKDYETIIQIFKEHKKFFPHIRADYLRRCIMNNDSESKLESNNRSSNSMIFDKGVVLTYSFYKRKNKIGDVLAQPGDCILHQIAVKNRDGSAKEILNKFFDSINTRAFLSVRRDNEIAKKFYEKNNMVKVGEIFWSNGKIPGDVYLYDRRIK